MAKKKSKKKTKKRKKIESNEIELDNEEKSDSEIKVKSDTYTLQGFERYMFMGLFIGGIIFLLFYLFGLIYFLIT
jgi:hypothetical protein